MKPHPSLGLLLLAAGWMECALANVRIAIKSDREWRIKFLAHAKRDASRFHLYTRMWYAQSCDPEPAA